MSVLEDERDDAEGGADAEHVHDGGLDRRKKQRTAQAIEDAALRLFAEHGFAATTIADIADAAEIAPRTFFAYFPSKESVLFGDFDATFRSLAEYLDTRGEQRLLNAIRAWIVDTVEREGLLDEREQRRREIIDATDELLAHERQLTTRFETLIAAAAATELGTEPDDLHPRIIAAAAAASFTALRPAPGSPPPPDDADPFAALDDALAFLRGGIDALHARRSHGTDESSS